LSRTDNLELVEIPDYVVGPGGELPAEAAEAQVFAAMLGAAAVLIVLPRFAVAQIDPDGRLAAGDAAEAALRKHGAQPLRDLEFAADPVPGWLVTIDEAGGGLRIAGPDDSALFDGDVTFAEEWYRLVAESARRGRGVVVLVGSAGWSPESVMEMIDAGRASWVRSVVAYL
jgi:hypothetical protein